MPSRAAKLFAIVCACLGLTVGLAACGGSDKESIALTETPGAPRHSVDAGESTGGGGKTKTPPAQTAPQEKPDESAEESPAAGGSDDGEGKAVFTQACAGCHTLAAAGATGSVGPNLDDARLSEEAIAEMVRTGGSGMPSFGGTLQPEQIEVVAAYVAAAAGS